MTGTMVRVMMFHSSLTETGITGWMLRMFCVPIVRPDVQVGVVLERHADQVADRVLGELGQFLGTQFGVRGTRKTHGTQRNCYYPPLEILHDRSRKNALFTLHACKKDVELLLCHRLVIDALEHIGPPGRRQGCRSIRCSRRHESRRKA